MAGPASDRYADLALATWLDELTADRRVLWLGAADGEAPDRLALRARSVLVLAPDPPPKHESRQRGARISALRPGPLSFRPGSFDVVVIPDVGAVGLEQDGRLDDLRDVLGDEGVLVAGTPADEARGLGYDVLFDLLAERFPTVHMLGQGRFAGFSVVDFGAVAGDYEITLDGSLVEEEEQVADRWLAVATADGPVLDAYSLIQVPVGAREAAAEGQRRRRRREPRPAERVSVDESPALDARVAELEAHLVERRAEVDAANEHAEALEQSLAEGATELERLRDLLDGREREAHALREAMERLEAEIEARRAREEQAPQPAPAADADEDLAADYDRLERALADQAARMRDLQGEVERRGTLVRDLVEELREVRASAAEPDPIAAQDAQDAQDTQGTQGTRDGQDDAAARRELDAAIDRALAAEASRAEAQFQIDELMGRLAQAGDSDEIRTLRAREARLAGTVRGLRSRLAEVEELRQLAEGRLAVAQLDLEDQRRRNLALERDIGEIRERLELEMVRSRPPEAGSARGSSPEPSASEPSDRERELEASEQHLSRRVGELSGQLVACRDLLLQVTEERDHARADGLRLTALVGSLEDRFAGARRGYEQRIAELVHDGTAPLQAELATLRRMAAELRGEREGLRARLADRELALSSATAATPAELEQARAESARLRTELDRLRREDTELAARVTDAEDRARREEERAAEVAANAAARDGLVTRLQMDLAAEEVRRQELSQRLARADEENERLRGALLDASEQVDEAIAAEDRMTRLRRGVQDSREMLTETRRVLSELATALGGPLDGSRREITAVGMEAPRGDGTDGGDEVLRRRIAELEEQRADQETLMRSLTAQIEERDDRLRALERRLEGGEELEGDEETLRRELMELQERAARLSDELLHERKARRQAEDESRKRGGSGDDEVRRLHERLGQSDAELLLLRGEFSTAERDLKTVKEACAQARNGLEELLGTATANGDPATAERIGSLIRLLNRF